MFNFQICFCIWQISEENLITWQFKAIPLPMQNLWKVLQNKTFNGGLPEVQVFAGKISRSHFIVTHYVTESHIFLCGWNTFETKGLNGKRLDKNKRRKQKKNICGWKQKYSCQEKTWWHSNLCPCFHFLMEDKLSSVGAAGAEVKNIICSTALNFFSNYCTSALLHSNVPDALHTTLRYGATVLLYYSVTVH